MSLLISGFSSPEDLRDILINSNPSLKINICSENNLQISSESNEINISIFNPKSLSSNDELKKLNSILESKNTTIKSNEEVIAKLNSTIASLQKQQNNLFDEFVKLRNKYDELKENNNTILWKYCSPYHPHLLDIPAEINNKKFVENDKKLGYYIIKSLLGEGQFASVKKCYINKKLKTKLTNLMSNNNNNNNPSSFLSSSNTKELINNKKLRRKSKEGREDIPEFYRSNSSSSLSFTFFNTNDENENESELDDVEVEEEDDDDETDDEDLYLVQKKSTRNNSQFDQISSSTTSVSNPTSNASTNKNKKVSIQKLKPYALKIIKKELITSFTSLTRVSNEINCLKHLSSPYIIKIIDVINTKENLYIITELGGSDLFNFFDENPSGINISTAKEIISSILKGVFYCHLHSICHRDLKPENILLTFNPLTRKVENLKLCDFGLSKKYSNSLYLTDFCGSPGFFAPEMILYGNYIGEKADLWSIGCIMLELLLGNELFCDLWMVSYDYTILNNKKNFYYNIKNSIKNVKNYFYNYYKIITDDIQDDKGEQIKVEETEQQKLERLKKEKEIEEFYVEYEKEYQKEYKNYLIFKKDSIDQVDMDGDDDPYNESEIDNELDHIKQHNKVNLNYKLNKKLRRYTGNIENDLLIDFLLYFLDIIPSHRLSLYHLIQHPWIYITLKDEIFSENSSYYALLKKYREDYIHDSKHSNSLTSSSNNSLSHSQSNSNSSSVSSSNSTASLLVSSTSPATPSTPAQSTISLTAPSPAYESISYPQTPLKDSVTNKIISSPNPQALSIQNITDSINSGSLNDLSLSRNISESSNNTVPYSSISTPGSSFYMKDHHVTPDDIRAAYDNLSEKERRQIEEYIINKKNREGNNSSKNNNIINSTTSISNNSINLPPITPATPSIQNVKKFLTTASSPVPNFNPIHSDGHPNHLIHDHYVDHQAHVHSITNPHHLAPISSPALIRNFSSNLPSVSEDSFSHR